MESPAAPEKAGEQVPRLLIGDAGEIGALRIDPGDRARHAEIRDAFYHDVEERTAEAAALQRRFVGEIDAYPDSTKPSLDPDLAANAESWDVDVRTAFALTTGFGRGPA